jgi:hypothetical protein
VCRKCAHTNLRHEHLSVDILLAPPLPLKRAVFHVRLDPPPPLTPHLLQPLPLHIAQVALQLHSASNTTQHARKRERQRYLQVVFDCACAGRAANVLGLNKGNLGDTRNVHAQ